MFVASGTIIVVHFSQVLSCCIFFLYCKMPYAFSAHVFLSQTKTLKVEK